jgi:hypothetical protein
MIMSMKNSSDTIGNRTRDMLAVAAAAVVGFSFVPIFLQNISQYQKLNNSRNSYSAGQRVTWSLHV